MGCAGLERARLKNHIGLLGPALIRVPNAGHGPARSRAGVELGRRRPESGPISFQGVGRAPERIRRSRATGRIAILKAAAGQETTLGHEQRERQQHDAPREKIAELTSVFRRQKERFTVNRHAAGVLVGRPRRRRHRRTSARSIAEQRPGRPSTSSRTGIMKNEYDAMGKPAGQHRRRPRICPSGFEKKPAEVVAGGPGAGWRIRRAS